MELHISVEFHDELIESEDELKHNSYVEYSRKIMKMVDDIQNRKNYGSKRLLVQVSLFIDVFLSHSFVCRINSVTE